MNKNILLHSIFIPFLWISLLIPASAAVISVDSFDQGDYSINDLNDYSLDVDLPFAFRRFHDMDGCPLPATSFSSSIDTNSGLLHFRTTGGASLPTCPLKLTVAYLGEQMYDISSAGGFILGVTQISGTGTLSIEVGGEEAFSALNKVNLTGPGEFFYPLSKVHENTGFSLEAFNILIFKIEANSPDFSITLDEIRLVPEPGAATLSAAALAIAALRRNRRRARRRQQ
jgi:hypothetical protein